MHVQNLRCPPPTNFCAVTSQLISHICVFDLVFWSLKAASDPSGRHGTTQSSFAMFPLWHQSVYWVSARPDGCHSGYVESVRRPTTARRRQGDHTVACETLACCTRCHRKSLLLYCSIVVQTQIHVIIVGATVLWRSVGLRVRQGTGSTLTRGPLQGISSKLLSTVCSGQLSLLSSVGWEMSSSLPGVGYGVKA